MRQPATTRSASASWKVTLAVVLAAAALFSITVTDFEARVTDLSAARVLRGQVPYRDFWTMYAPGSFSVLAVAFAAFGRELLLSNVLGVLFAATSIGAYHRLAVRGVSPVLAAIPSLVVAVAFLRSGYHNGFTSYPPAILLIWLGVGRLAEFTRTHARREVILAGMAFGLAMLFKHDLTGYACLAAAAALLGVSGTRIGHRLQSVGLLAAAVLAVVTPAVALLVALGAGPDMAQNLLVWPLTDFRYVRPENFPLLPSLKTTALATARGLLHWAMLTIPLLAAAVALVLLWKKRPLLDQEQRFLVLFAMAFYPIVWTAAHVQINTHAVTMAALGALLATVGIFGPSRVTGAHSRRALQLVFVAGILWSGLLLVEPVARLTIGLAEGRRWLGLSHLRGITAWRKDATEMRQLAAALDEAAPADVPLLLLGNRNDILVYAEGIPYWLTDRPMVTRHHELHPGITDTEIVQRSMLREIESVGLPVLVREYRFKDDALERIKADFLKRVPVGSTLLDEWLVYNYVPGPRFGSYELMEPRRRAAMSSRDSNRVIVPTPGGR